MVCCFSRWLFLVLVFDSAAGLGVIDDILGCGWDVLCAKKHHQLNITSMNSTNNGIKRCSCDKDCSRYADCCLDMAQFPRKNITEEFSCVPISANPFQQSIYAVSNCISIGSIWTDRCEKRSNIENPYQYILDVPVYSNITELHYANKYCALCDPRISFKEDISKKLYSSQKVMKIKCTSNIAFKLLFKTGKYMKGQLKWRVGKGYCEFTFKVGELKNARVCTPSVSKCPSGTETEISAKCNAYSLLLRVEGKMYRNPHCAICNGVSKSNLFCMYRHNNIMLPSLSEIFSFDWSFDSCNFPETMKWDTTLRRCIAMNCPIIGRCKYTVCKNSRCFHLRHRLGRIIDGYLTYACLSVSIVCLLIHVFISIFISHPKNLPFKIVNSLAWSLLVAQTLFLSGLYSLVELPQVVCYCIAVTIQFFFLASFFWMNVISIDICYTFSNSSLKNYSSKSYMKYALYSWGGAGVITGFSIVTDLTNILPDAYRPQYTSRQNVCWFGNWTGMGLFFYFPILITHLLNCMLFAIALCKFRKMHCTSKKIVKSGKPEYSRLWLYIKLSTIMGIMWAIGTITSISNRPDYHFPFTVLNGLQGAFIFIMFDLKIEAIFYYLERLALAFLKGKMNDKKKAIEDVNEPRKVSTSSGTCE